MQGESDCRKYFMISVHERMLPTREGVFCGVNYKCSKELMCPDILGTIFILSIWTVKRL